MWFKDSEKKNQRGQKNKKRTRKYLYQISDRKLDSGKMSLDI